MNELELLGEKIRTGSAIVGIYGLGYVGLPLALRFAEVGIKVIGFDVDTHKVECLNSGRSYIERIQPEQIQAAALNGLEATTDFSRTAEADALIICVPTPLNAHREPDLSFVLNTVESLLPYFRPGQLLSLESTTWPGTTDEQLAPRLQARGFTPGNNCALVFSPEREDPGNPDYGTHDIPKVIGGMTTSCLNLGVALYQHAIKTMVPVSSPKVAEMSKLLENIHRAVNIGLVNEMKIVADKMGINIHEVIRAAATKPFGFMPFYPGPGLGGHCIPIDPFYLSWKTKQAGIEARFIELAGYINGNMPHFVVDKIQNALNEHAKALKGSRVHVLGVAYKRNIDDVRESPALDIIHLLGKRGASVTYSDPFVPHLHADGAVPEMTAIDADRGAAEADCVVIVTDHKGFDYARMVERAKLIVDTRNALKGNTSEKIVRL